MNAKTKRALGALLLALATSTVGYLTGSSQETNTSPHFPTVTVTAPPPGSTRVVYSLDKQQADDEIIALINAAKTHIYFAIYTFTLTDIAEALVAAKKRGVDVYGIVDSGQSEESFSKPVIALLTDAGIPLVTEKHAGSNGIMHIKTLVTDSAYATGSYNWTKSASTINDEVLEIGTDETLRKTYEDLLKSLLDAYAGNTVAAGVATNISAGIIDYTDAPAHVGETASIRGKLIDTYTSKTGTVFLNFCADYRTCPFTGVIFSSDAKKFASLEDYVGSTIMLTGKIKSYEGKAEIILENPNQLTK